MSAFALVTGTIFRAPTQRTSKAGRPYTTLTVKVGTDDNAGGDFWSVLCFSESGQFELLRLAVGERVAIQGSMKLEIFEKDGQARISRTIFVDHVLALRAPPKERKPKASAAKAPTSSQPAATNPPTSAPPFDDGIPFLAEWR